MVGFLYSGGSFTDIVPPSSTSTVAFGINDSGVVVGYYVDSNNLKHGFTFNGSSYTTIDAPGSVSTIAIGINGSGDITLTYIDS